MYWVRLIFGGNFVLVSRGAYMQGAYILEGLYSGFYGIKTLPVKNDGRAVKVFIAQRRKTEIEKV